MNALPIITLAFPLASAVITAAIGWRRITSWLGAISSIAVLICGILMGKNVLDVGARKSFFGLLYLDALGAYMVIVVGAVATITTWYGISYINAELRLGETNSLNARRYGFLVQLFIAAMLSAVLAANLGLTWIAIEATTIATAFLVHHRRSLHSLEASWKYVVIGSVGVGLAFLGTVFLYLASQHGVHTNVASLEWRSLVNRGGDIDKSILRIAVALLVLGYGTKVGLAPMHTWLPDAHSQAPAPVSALMSGVLLAVAFSVVLRVKSIADAALGPHFMQVLLIVAALLSLVVGASLLISQRDYKRMLAYSSIEHMGFIAFSAALGSKIALTAGLLHVLVHGLVKAVLFCTSGEILLMTATTKISHVRGLLAKSPFVGGVFGLGLLALVGLPPSALFVTELTIARAGFHVHAAGITSVALLGMLAAFGALVHHGASMLLGTPLTAGGSGNASQDRSEHASGNLKEEYRTPFSVKPPLFVGLFACAVLGVTIWPLSELLAAATETVM